MNKRKYPYGINMCPQLKIHISEKEVANGVSSSLKMSEIYEKTKHLLYQRATGASSIDRIADLNTNKTLSNSLDSKPFKQLQLTLDGKLIKPNTFAKNPKIHNNIQQKCNFCSQSEKLDFCGTCGDIFCNMCSFSLCSNDINRICLTCYK